MKDNKRWACIARLGGFGDNLIASSVLKGLKKRYGNVEVITGTPWDVMFDNNPYIDKLTIFPEGSPEWGDGHSWQKWFHERSKEYAFFANLSHSCEVTGALLRIQTQYWWPASMRRSLCNRSYLELVHDICEIPRDEIDPRFFETDEEKTQAIETKEKIGEKVIGWVLSGSRIDKVHPMADLAIARVIKETGIPVILFGGPGKDLELAKAIRTEVIKHNKSDKGLHIAISDNAESPNWPPRRICAQIKQCDLVVGPDTGPMWAIAMEDMPKVLMASHAGGYNVSAHWKNTTTLEADRERVPCYPCHKLIDGPEYCVPNADKNGAACISDISVDDIVTTVIKLLEGN